MIKKAKEGKPAASDQRHLCANTFITDITATVEIDRWELVQAHGVMTKLVQPLLTRI
jgi:hypothetical protein